jgi:phytoene synthase
VDLDRGRIYLPTDAMRRHHLEDDDLHRRDPLTRGRITELIREQAAYARRCYAVATAALPETERPRVLGAEIMASVYRELLRKIERTGCGVLDRELRVGAVHRAWLALRIAARARLGIAAVSGSAT